MDERDEGHDVYEQGRQERAAEKTLSKRATPSEVSGLVADAALSGDLSDGLKTMLRAYGKRKKLEMERYGVRPEDMRKRYETMRDWCQGVLDITKRGHKREVRLEALDVLRATIFGGRFDDVGKVGGRAVFPKGITRPHCEECNDWGMVYKEIVYEYETATGVGLCHCGWGTKRRDAIAGMGRKQPKKKRGEEF